MNELFKKAREIIDSDVRPMVQGDGGDIEVVELTPDFILKVRMQGACANCPSSAVTLAFGIEARIKELIPEIKSVIQIE